MPWIRVFTDYDDNPKTIRLKEILKNPLADAYPQRLWRWALKHAPGGDLKKFSHQTISKACGWKRDPTIFVMALVGSGFIDRDTMQIHDWKDGSGQYETQTKHGRARVAKHRGNADVTVTSSEVTVTSAHVTRPDLDPDSDSDPDSERSNPAPKPRWHPPGDLPGFARFWSLHPNREEGKGCEKIWRKENLESIADIIVAALEDQLTWDKYRGADVQFMPHSPKWLRKRRWEDPRPLARASPNIPKRTATNLAAVTEYLEGT